MKTPISAQPILQARLKGYKPADLVIVSMVGRINELNPTVFVNGPDYDFTFLRGLEICLYVDEHCKWRRTLEAIMAQEPAKSLLWDANRFEGAYVYYLPTLKAVERGIPPFERELSFIPWLPFQNLAFFSD